MEMIVVSASGAKKTNKLCSYFSFFLQMFYKHHQMGNLHNKTMNLLDLLGNFLWSDKMALILAGLAFKYSEFWLVNRLRHQNALAGLISVLRQFPNDMELLKPRLKALNLLMEKMVELTEHVAKFDSLPISEVNMDHGLIEITKNHMYLAAYWVARSAIRGSSHIIDLRAVKAKRVHVLSLPSSICSTFTFLFRPYRS